MQPIKNALFAQGFFIALFFGSLHLNLKNKIMGRGDKKTKKGKIFKGSFGKSRPAGAKKITGTTPVKAEKKA